MASVNLINDRDVLRERQWMERMLEDLAAARFYGRIEVKFECGRIVQVIKNQRIFTPTRANS